MQKKLIVVAVAGAILAPALAIAQSSTVQIYGRGTFEYSYMDRGAGTSKGDGLQTPGGSSIGVKGEEKLGGGLSAWFQCETSADLTEGGDGLCTRNSALGFKGGFGNVFVGRWDTPFKQAHSLGSGVGSESTGVQGNTSLTVGSSTGQIGIGNRAIWERRQANLISYNSPKFGGFDVRAAFSSLEATGLATPTNKNRLWSLAGIYSAGPLAIGVGYELHKDVGNPGTAAFGTANALGGVTVTPAVARAAGLDDEAFAISAKYKFGKTLVGGSYNNQKYELSTAGANAKRDAWTIGVEHNLSGPHNIEASYTRAEDMKGTLGATPGATLPGVGPNTGAKQYQIAYRHTLSKRTEFRLAYVVVDNDSGTNTYALGGVGRSPTPPTGVLGEKQTGLSLLVKHTF